MPLPRSDSGTDKATVRGIAMRAGSARKRIVEVSRGLLGATFTDKPVVQPAPQRLSSRTRIDYRAPR
jgi:hypothetical protein